MRTRAEYEPQTNSFIWLGGAACKNDFDRFDLIELGDMNGRSDMTCEIIRTFLNEFSSPESKRKAFKMLLPSCSEKLKSKDLANEIQWREGHHVGDVNLHPHQVVITKVLRENGVLALEGGESLKKDNLEQRGGIYKSFCCEICEDEIFEGHTAFAEHFKRNKHLMGLRKLGLEWAGNEKMLQGLGEIEKAKGAWKHIVGKKAKKLRVVGNWRRFLNGILEPAANTSKALLFNDSDDEEEEEEEEDDDEEVRAAVATSTKRSRSKKFSKKNKKKKSNRKKSVISKIK